MFTNLLISCYVYVGALDGKLYAVGGECETKFAHEGTLYLSSVEYYDPIHNEWTTVRDMKHSRSFTAVAVLGSKSFMQCTCTYHPLKEDTSLIGTHLQVPTQLKPVHIYHPLK